MTSLRRRLLLWLLPATFFAGVLASVGTYWGAVFELGDLLNDQMRYIAEHVRIESSGRASIIDTSKSLDPEKADEILLQVWDKQGQLRYSSDPQLSLPAPQGTGLINLEVDGQPWHTFVSRRDDTLIQVAQAKDARWEALADLSIHLLWPVLSLVPVLAVFLWFGISYGLRPLRKIAAELAQRNALSLEPIQTNDLPDEVSPLVGEVNSLLRRLEHSFALQKDFIADAAHELRTPVMALSIQAQLMQRASDESERQSALSQLLQAVERLNHLTQQLLTLARLEPEAGIPQMQPVELTALCKSVVMQHVRLAEAKQIDLGLAQSDLGIVSGDPETLRILLNNLVVNAINYIPTQGRIDLRVCAHEQGVLLEVSDNGPGIAPNERSSVLERFYRGRQSGHPGSGLGLSIVQRIAEQHGARVSLDSGADGVGLCVQVYFPPEN